MKPHYKLVNGKPARVGLVQGRKVMLVPVRPNPELEQPHCSQCTFFEPCQTITPEASRRALDGASCTDAFNLVYKAA